MFEKLRKRVEALDERWRYLSEWHSEESTTVLEFYLKIFPKAAHAEQCKIFVRIPTRAGMLLEVGTDQTSREIDFNKDTDTVVKEVLTTGNSRIINGSSDTEAQQEGAIASNMLCIPLKSLNGRDVVGAILLLNKQGSQNFDDADRESVEDVSHFLEVRLENIYFNVRPMDISKSIIAAVNKIMAVALGLLVILSSLLGIYWFIFSL